MQGELREMGALVGDSIYHFQQQDRLNEPVLTQWDAWGNRIDHIEVSPLWKEAERLAAKAGVVAEAFDATHSPYARVHQFALAYVPLLSEETLGARSYEVDSRCRRPIKSWHAAHESSPTDRIQRPYALMLKAYLFARC